jgi:hypothetical protein
VCIPGSLIKSRLDNKFYRRVTAIQFDVRYIATNAECYNRQRTDIVKNARILTDLVLRIIQDAELTDINAEYHRLMDNFRWEDTQEPRYCKLSFYIGIPSPTIPFLVKYKKDLALILFCFSVKQCCGMRIHDILVRILILLFSLLTFKTPTN